MKLPEEFLKEMEEILKKDELENFLLSYNEKPKAAVKLNPNKEISVSSLPFCASPLLGVPGGYLVDFDEKVGLHPYHDAGAYYAQEPSAMSAPALLNVKEGDRVLDLCAAPGGKAWQLCASAGKSGFFMANEPIPKRAKILSENLERMGLGHALITNEYPQKLKKAFSGFFDKILVDAPCSGEGMFRKDPLTVSEWSKENVDMCHERQVEILLCACDMLKSGGDILYCTCTFNRLENEGTINRLISERSDMSILSTFRQFPHTSQGEGHFMALLHKDGEPEPNRTIEKNAQADELSDIAPSLTFSRIEKFGDYVCAIQEDTPDLKGLRVERAGLQLYSEEKKRIKPAHALAMSISPDQAKYFVDLDIDSARKYIEGQALNIEAPKGWVLVTFDSLPLGWAKSADGRLQNHRPKGLRR